LQAKIALSVRFGRGLTLPSLDCSSVLRLRFRALVWDKVRCQSTEIYKTVIGGINDR
jgi:hypothetical protein